MKWTHNGGVLYVWVQAWYFHGMWFSTIIMPLRETDKCDGSHEGKSGLDDSEIGRELDILGFYASSR
jgi:hypothetical protein